MSEEYFARRDAPDLAAECEERLGQWANQMVKNGLKAKWQKAYRLYYGRHWRTNPYFRDSEIIQTGDDGELSALTVNDFRNLIKHMLVLTTNQKISFDPRATNSDDKSLTQTRIAKIVIDYYVREKRIRRFLRQAAEMALLFGKGFIKCTWDKNLGKPYSVEDYTDHKGMQKQKVINEGDIKLGILDPFSFLCDQNVESWEDVQWCITREWVNKYDLMAQRPDLADKIEAIPTKNMMQGMNYLALANIDDSALVPVYDFYHERSDALINGRYCRFVNRDIVLSGDADPMPYDELPVFRIVPGEMYGSTEGYSESFDIMNLQQAENVLASTFYTNQSTFGVQNILMPEGCNLSALQLAKALQVLRYNPAAGKPEALQLTATPKELWTGLDYISKKMETVFGMNSVARGNPGQEELSGKAMGLLQSMAIQYSSAFQESYVELAEDVGTFIIKLLKQYANTERMASISGKFNRGDMVKFKKDDLSEIERVVVELGNPMQKTLAGRLDIARDLLSNGLIKNAQEYIQVLDTGELEASTEAPEAQLSCIRQENEAMLDGQPVPALVGDRHLDHINEHYALLSKPEARMNSPFAQIVLQHIQQHCMLYRTQDPIWNMIKQEPPAPPPPGMMPMGPPGMPPPGAHPNGPAPGGHPGPQQGMQKPPVNEPPQQPPGPQEALQQALK